MARIKPKLAWPAIMYREQCESAMSGITNNTKINTD
jgi:hypothetical protein